MILMNFYKEYVKQKIKWAFKYAHFINEFV